MADSLGTIYAELRLRLDQFKQDIQTASTEIKDLKNNVSDNMSAMSTVGGAMKDVGKSMSKYVTAPIVAAGTASVYMFTQFEEAMSQVKAVGDMTDDQLKSMTDLAMEMGAKTKFSALEAANAMFELTKLGFDANEMMTALPATMDLAAAGGVGLAEASVIVAQSMNMFGEDASQTTRYADVFAKAAAMGALDVTTLGDALSYAGPSAAAMGYSLEDTAAALAVFSDAGIDSTRAGTTFEALMRDMKKKAMENGGALTFLGKAGEEVAISMYDANGKIRPLVDIVRDLGTATEGMTDAQRDAALSNVANTQGLRGLNVLLSKGADYLQTYTDEIYNSSGAGDAMAKTMQDNLAGSLEQLGGSLETAGIALGEVLAPVIRDIADGIKALVDWFGSLSPTGKKVVVIVAAIVAAIGPLLFIIGAILAMVPAIATGFGVVSAAAAPVLLPILAIVAAIAAVIAIGVLLYKNWDKIKAWAIEVWGAIKDFFVGLWDGVKEWFLGIWNGIKDGVSGIWNGIKDTASKVWNGIKDTASKAWNGVKDAIGTATGAAKAVVQDSLNNMKKAYDENGGGIKGSVAAAWEGIKGVYTGGVRFIDKLTGGKLAEVWNKFKESMSGAWTAVKDWFTSVGQWFQELPAKVGGAISTFFTETLPYWIGYGLGKAVGFIRDGITAIIDWFKALPGKIAEFVNTVKENIVTGFNAVVTFFAELPARIWAWLLVVWDNIKLWVAGAWETLTTGVSNMLNAVVTFFSELPAKIWAWLVLAWENIKTWVSNVWTSMTTGVSNAINAVVKFFSELPAKVWTWLVNVITNIVKWGSDLFTNARTAATKLWDGFIGFIKDIPAKVTEIFTNVVNGIKNFGQKMWDGARSIASNLWNGFKDGLGIHSPSYIEEAMKNILVKSGAMVGDMKQTFSSLNQMRVNPPALTDVANAMNTAFADLSGKLTPTMTLAYAGLPTPPLSTLGVNGVQKQEVTHVYTGEIVHKGVNDKGEFVDSVNAVMDEIRRGNRR